MQYSISKVLRKGQFVLLKRYQICVGDIVEVKVDGTFPCDMCLLYSTAQNNAKQCHITTANLDGETNLKVYGFELLCIY